MHIIKRFTQAITLAITAAILITQTSFASLDAAKKFIEDTSDQVIAIIENTGFSDEEKQEHLSKLFTQSVDTGWMAQFTLGKYARNTDKKTLQEYKELYTKFLLLSYIPRFREYNNEKIHITNAYNQYENEYTIETTITSRKNQQPILVAYKIRKTEGSYKIFDIIAEGISLITTQRSEFNSILSRNGITSLIEKMENKVTASKQ